MRSLLETLLIPVIFSVSWLTVVHAESRPNILWITAEDMSPVLGSYGDETQFSTYRPQEISGTHLLFRSESAIRDHQQPI